MYVQISTKTRIIIDIKANYSIFYQKNSLQKFILKYKYPNLVLLLNSI